MSHYYRFDVENGQLKTVVEITKEEWDADPNKMSFNTDSEPVLHGTNGHRLIRLPAELRSKTPVDKLARPIIAVSDLHAGDGGPRDNFAVPGRETEFIRFLDYVDSYNAQLVIVGDLFELWQSTVSKVFQRRRGMIDRLAEMEAIYVLGNHDADLREFVGTDWLQHPFFRRMVNYYQTEWAGRTIRFIHGHSADPYCESDIPGLGRVSAIYSGIWESRYGRPTIEKFGPARKQHYATVEDATIGRIERLMTLWRKLWGKPGRFEEINQHLIEEHRPGEILVTGHTHRAGKIRGHEIYNTGTWAENTCSFVTIDSHATLVWDWVEGQPPEPNKTVLEF
jgi:UDP-2,3-diacylglucosamine pyrophosphatase LpxH